LREREIVEPTNEVKVRFACLGISEADVLVDQPAVNDEADVVPDQATAEAILEDHSLAGRVLQHGPEE